MIEQLRIRDLGVIADAVLPLGPGFTAITGETGAGKTMVITALGLLMGERSDAGAVRTTADAARVGGLVRTDDPAVVELVEDAGGVVEEGDLTLSRTVSAEGRSRASVGGAGAPVGVLTKLSEKLFALHGQSDQLRLRSAAAQREMLDRFGGQALLSVLAEFQNAHVERKTVAEQLTELETHRSERIQEADRLREQLEEIAAVDPQPDEEVALKARIERLSNLEELREATSAALRGLSNESGDPFAADVGGLLDQAVRDIERVAAADSRLSAIAETLRTLAFQVGDASRDLASYASDLDEDGPAELTLANERLAELNGLLRSYGATTVEVLEQGAAAALKLGELDGDDDRIDELTLKLEQCAATEQTLASRLSQLRQTAAARLSAEVSAELRELAMPDATFVAEVHEAELGQHGADEVRLLLQPHAGAAPRAIAKGASGGELSRVMLAIEVVVAASDPVPTFVFDEVDAGVGGAAAIEIGRRLARLSKSAQVIVVTHLAQVAAFANNHVQIAKDSEGGFTQSSCTQLHGDARLAEMARLLSGMATSENARAHAAELLELAVADQDSR